MGAAGAAGAAGALGCWRRRGRGGQGERGVLLLKSSRWKREASGGGGERIGAVATATAVRPWTTIGCACGHTLTTDKGQGLQQMVEQAGTKGLVHARAAEEQVMYLMHALDVAGAVSLTRVKVHGGARVPCRTPKGK